METNKQLAARRRAIRGAFPRENIRSVPVFYTIHEIAYKNAVQHAAAMMAREEIEEDFRGFSK